MAKFKLKLDKKQIVDFFKTRYEICAVAGAGFLVLLFLILGLSKWVSASSPEPEIVKDEKKIAQARAAAGSGDDNAGPPKAPNSVWDRVVPDKDFKATLGQAYFEVGAAGENRREQPRILAVDSDPKSIQVDTRLGAIYTFDVVGDKMRVVKGGSDALYNISTQRLVVVSGTFPYFDQCEQFRKALRLDSIYELFTKGLAPTLEGLIVERCEVTKKNGMEVEGPWKEIYGQDKEGLPTASDAIKKVMQIALLDEKEVEKYSYVIAGQTVTPLPLMVKGDYPEIKFDFEKIKDGDMTLTPTRGPITLRTTPIPAPAPRTETVGPGNVETMDIDKVGGGVLKEQLSGKINWFDPYGAFFKEKDAETGEGGKEPETPTGKKDPMAGLGDKKKGKPAGPGSIMPPTGPGSFPPGKEGMIPTEDRNPRMPATLPAYRKALIRFVDVEVEPGKSYKYRFKVRIANPNYGLSTRYVLNSEYSRPKEFETPGWAVTPTVSIPKEYFMYVINQEKYFHSLAVGPGGANSRESLTPAPDKVPFQIHMYVDSAPEEAGAKTQISDWMVAEHIFVGRGEQVGRRVDMELIGWNKFKNQVEIFVKQKSPKGPLGPVFGYPIDFSPRQPIFLVDFIGNKQTYKVGTTPVSDDSACEALLLMPDMSLAVRNSRNDMNDGYEGGKPAADGIVRGTPSGIERRERLEQWRTRLEEVRQASMPTMPTKGKDGKDSKDKN